MLQQPQLSQGGLELLPAALQLLLQLRVEAAQLLVLQPYVGLLAAQLLDPGVQLSDQTHRLFFFCFSLDETFRMAPLLLYLTL